MRKAEQTEHLRELRATQEDVVVSVLNRARLLWPRVGHVIDDMKHEVADERQEDVVPHEAVPLRVAVRVMTSIAFQRTPNILSWK